MGSLSAGDAAAQPRASCAGDALLPYGTGRCTAQDEPCASPGALDAPHSTSAVSRVRARAAPFGRASERRLGALQPAHSADAGRCGRDVNARAEQPATPPWPPPGCRRRKSLRTARLYRSAASSMRSSAEISVGCKRCRGATFSGAGVQQHTSAAQEGRERARRDGGCIPPALGSVAAGGGHLPCLRSALCALQGAGARAEQLTARLSPPERQQPQPQRWAVAIPAPPLRLQPRRAASGQGGSAADGRRCARACARGRCRHNGGQRPWDHEQRCGLPLRLRAAMADAGGFSWLGEVLVITAVLCLRLWDAPR